MKETPGIRIADNTEPTKPGEYALLNRHNGEKDWVACPPKEGMRAGTFLKNSVIEHEDGTITVEPLITYNANYPDLPQWQGNLIKGVWIESPKVFIKCKECGCTKEIYPKEIPKGDCKFCEKDFGYYMWIIGEAPEEVRDLLPLHEGDILVIKTASPHTVKDNEPNFNRIFSIERDGKIIYQDKEPC